jgi:ketosteroid isomerase-like protein
MSNENVELLRKAFSAYNAAFHSGDTSAFLELVERDVEWHTSTGVMDPVYRGHEELRRWMTEFYESWDELSVEPEEFIHVDPERVVVALRLRGRGKASGIDVDMLLYEVFSIREGKLVERRAFREKVPALEAAGLPRQGSRAERLNQ